MCAETAEVLAWTKEAEQLRTSFTEATNTGRQVLVVVGAGCAVSAGMPEMQGIYSDLYRRVSSLPSPSSDRQAVKDLLLWLKVLSSGAAPRSIAAKALGSLQLVLQR
jgi:hypothetical protein